MSMEMEAYDRLAPVWRNIAQQTGASAHEIEGYMARGIAQLSLHDATH